MPLWEEGEGAMNSEGEANLMEEIEQLQLVRMQEAEQKEKKEEPLFYSRILAKWI